MKVSTNAAKLKKKKISPLGSENSQISPTRRCTPNIKGLAFLFLCSSSQFSCHFFFLKKKADQDRSAKARSIPAGGCAGLGYRLLTCTGAGTKRSASNQTRKHTHGGMHVRDKPQPTLKHESAARDTQHVRCSPGSNKFLS